MKGKVRVRKEDKNVQSAVSYILRNYVYGELIENKTLQDLSGFYDEPIIIPSISEKLAVSDVEKQLAEQKLNFMSFKNRVADVLLKEHKKALKNKFGEGYVIVLPQEQATFAYNKIASSVLGAIGTSTKIVENTNTSKLTASQLKAHGQRSDAIKGLVKSLDKALNKAENSFEQIRSWEHNSAVSPIMDSLKGVTNEQRTTA